MSSKYFTRKSLFLDSYYESDQEDSKKDEDYNPNEYYEKIICCGSTSSSTISNSYVQPRQQRTMRKKIECKMPSSPQRVSTRIRNKKYAKL